MTRYADTTDLTRFGLSAAALTGVSTTTQEEALDAASAVLDGYIASRKKLPLTVWGDDLRRYVCHLAAYDLMVTRGYDPNAGNDDNLRLRYQDALDWGQRFSAGRVESPDMVDSTPADVSDERRSFMVTSARLRWRR